MKHTRLAARSRANLDRRLNAIRQVARFAPPVHGWIKAIRQALGMSSLQFARRLGVRPPSVVDLERSEAKATIQLSTLRRVAKALDCTLVYALVPNKPLAVMVLEQSRKAARHRLEAVAHTMRLENQTVAAKDLEVLLDEFARDIDPRAIWDEP
ncbi:MAG: mobile mystery protein A [Alphaproteobacteria bacterium]